MNRYALRSLSRGTCHRIPTRMKSSQVAALQVNHDQDIKEFYIELNNERAYIQYDFADSMNGTVDLQHTVVPQAFQGQGIAKVLAKEVMDHFATNGQSMILTCWYLKKYYKENPSPLYANKIVG